MRAVKPKSASGWYVVMSRPVFDDPVAIGPCQTREAALEHKDVDEHLRNIDADETRVVYLRETKASP